MEDAKGVHEGCWVVEQGSDQPEYPFSLLVILANSCRACILMCNITGVFSDSWVMANMIHMSRCICGRAGCWAGVQLMA